MSECYRLIFVRNVRQVIDFEIVAENADHARALAEKHLPQTSGWRTEERGSAEMLSCAPALKRAADA